MVKPNDGALRGTRLVVLRRLEGLTQADLADRLDLSQGFVSHVEKEAKALPLEVASRASQEFHLPGSFFTIPRDISEAGVATFRKSSRATVRDENYVKALFDEASRLFRMASATSGYRASDLASLAHEDEEEAAAALRSAWGLGASDPLQNATRAVERLGIGVIHALDPLDPNRRDHDGISRPSELNDRPLIATIGEQPAAVARMTLMHELGHLVYDRALAIPIRSRRSIEERRAFRFAGAVLIPAAVIRRRVTESLTLHGYLRLKADYGITVAALITRARDLSAISPERARSLFIQYSSYGWRRAEPVEVADENARLLTQAIHRGIGTTSQSVAEATGVPESLVRRWTRDESPARPLAPVIPLRRSAAIASAASSGG